MQTIIQQEQATDTLHIMEQLGEDRLNSLQQALDTHSPNDLPPTADRLINDMVLKHNQGNNQRDLAELGYATVADAIAEISISKNALSLFVKGKMGLQRAVNAHHQRAQQAAVENEKAELRELGVKATPVVYIDEPTDLHLVQLTTPEHCRYEGKRLLHCLGNLATAVRYLASGALIYSLRKGGTEPRATLEVDAKQARVVQARGLHDQPLFEGSDEYHALLRSLIPLAEYADIQPAASLVITDKILGRSS